MPASWPSTFHTDQPAVDAPTKVTDYTKLRDASVWLRQLAVGRQVFRGLHLRSHPDADLAAARVYLDHADEIVLEDASGNIEAVKDWDNLAANIATAGAGGLDTGAEAASTWYEAWAIRKSSDGTKNLLLHRALDWSTDSGQQFTTTDNGGRVLRLLTGTATDLLAQGFKTPTAGFPGKVQFADVKLLRTGAVSGRVWLEIRSDSGGDPSGTVLATSDKLDASFIYTTAMWIRFPFRIPFTTADTSTQYHLVLNGDYARSDTVHITWRGVAAGGYANGVAKEYNGTAWSAVGAVVDFNFSAYTERNNTALTMPTGYDQRAKIGYVRNNGSSNFVPFVQCDRRVYPMTEQGTGTTTSTIPVLLALEALLPPVHVAAEFALANATALTITGIGGVPDGYGGFIAGGLYRRNNFVWGYPAAASSAIPTVLVPEVPTDHQGLYLVVAGSTGQAFLASWEW